MESYAYEIRAVLLKLYRKDVTDPVTTEDGTDKLVD
jgi:hypothetical protein